ncbi:MAG: hypothetical protein H6983_13825 [Ectothiorhodospiraceae bacterium]|nr:hypothetical protein [Ectothiorhodospiraceae bacterium]
MEVEAIFAALPARANEDPALVRAGRHMHGEFLIEVGERAFHLPVTAGRVGAVVTGPLRLRSWSFAIRGAESVWREFWSALPAPGFQDIFAMSRYGHARIEGDLGPLLTHLRYVKGLLALTGRIAREGGR